jgi:hypothetical protein
MSEKCHKRKSRLHDLPKESRPEAVALFNIVDWFSWREAIRQCRNGNLQILTARLHRSHQDHRISKVRRFPNAGQL